MLHGLDVRLETETGMKIHIARDPLLAVVRGSGQCLEEFDTLSQVLFGSQDR
jgi:rod shape-determining protein MreB